MDDPGQDYGLFGRDSALERIRQRLHRLRRGEGALILVSGADGTGKTALALTAAAMAREIGAEVAIARGESCAGSDPFAVWRDLLEPLYESGRLDLARIAPPLGIGPAVTTVHQFVRQVVVQVREAASSGPLALMLDDIHSLDPDCLHLLDCVTRHARNLGILILATYVSRTTDPIHPLYQALPRLQRHRPRESISLGPLCPDAVRRLVEHSLGVSGRPWAERLAATTGGNPLLLAAVRDELELTGTMLWDQRDSSRRVHGSSFVPRSVWDLVVEKAARLDARARALLSTAAVAGGRWPVDLMAAVLQWPPDELDRALTSGAASGLIEPVSGPGRTYRFRHAAFRAVLEERLPGRERRRLHAELARALTRPELSHLPTAARLKAVAVHALRSEQWEMALEYGSLAADAFLKCHAPRTAVSLYRLAQTAAGFAPGPVDASTDLLLSQRRAVTTFLLRETGDLEPELLQLRDRARSAGDRGVEGRALACLAPLYLWSQRVEDARQTAAAAELAAAEVGDWRVSTAIFGTTAWVQISVGEMEAARLAVDRLERLARASDDRLALAWCLQWRAALLTHQGYCRLAAQVARDALVLAAEDGDPELASGASWLLGAALGELGRYEEAMAVLEEGLEEISLSGARLYEARLLRTLGWVLGELGDAGAGLRYARQSLDWYLSSESGADRADHQLALLTMAALELRSGRLEAAEARLDDFTPLAARPGALPPFDVNWYRLLRAELAELQGDHPRAARWAGEAAEHAQTGGYRGQAARADLLRGRALLSTGHVAEAIDALTGAVAVSDETEQFELAWQSRYVLGQAMAAGGHPELARVLLHEADMRFHHQAAGIEDTSKRSTFVARRSLPAVPLNTGDAPPWIETASEFPAGLTTREIEVLHKLALGLTNAEIAQTLRISVKTVNAHVSNILDKTASANRTAAVVFAVRSGLI